MDQKERDIVIRTVLGEAAGEGPQGQAAVAAVIKNRTLSGQYPTSPAKVALQPAQFSAWNSKSKQGNDLVNAYGPGDAQYEAVGKIVDGVFDGDIPDPTGGALNYWNPSQVNPAWSAAMEQTGDIGNHRFANPTTASGSSSSSDRQLGTIVAPSMGYTPATVPSWYSPTLDQAGVTWQTPNGPDPVYATNPSYAQNLTTYSPMDAAFAAQPNMNASWAGTGYDGGESDSVPTTATHSGSPFKNVAGETYTLPSASIVPRSYVNMSGLSDSANQALSTISKGVASTLPSMDVTSGYRSPSYNASVGGANQSQHMSGNAADISLKGMTDEQKQETVRAVLSTPNVAGFGYYPNSDSIHFDVREGDRKYWGPNYSANSFDGPDWMKSMVGDWANGTVIAPPVSIVPIPQSNPGNNPISASDKARAYGAKPDDKFSDDIFSPTPLAGALTSDALKTYATTGSMPAVSASDKARAYGSAQASLTPSAIQAAYARSQAQTAPAVSASDMARSYGANAARIAPYTAPNTTGITAQAIQDAYARSQAPAVSASDKARAYGAANTTPTSAEIGSRVDSATASQNAALQAALANYASHPASYTAPVASAPTVSASDRARAYGASQGTSGASSSTPSYSPTSASGASQSYGSVYSGSTPSGTSGASFNTPSYTSSYSAPGVSAQAGSGRYGAGTSLPSTSSSYSPDFSDNNPAWGVSAPAVTPTPAQQYQTTYETRYVPSTVFDTYGVAKNIVSDVGDLATKAYAALPSQDQVTAYLKNAIDQTAAAKKAVAAPKQVAKTVMVPKRVAVRVPVKPRVTYQTPTIRAPAVRADGLTSIGTGLAAIQKIQSGTAPRNSVATAANNAAGYTTEWSNTANNGAPVQTTHTPSGNQYSTYNIGPSLSPMSVTTYGAGSNPNTSNSGAGINPATVGGGNSSGGGGMVFPGGTSTYGHTSSGALTGGMYKAGGSVKKYR